MQGENARLQSDVELNKKGKLKLKQKLKETLKQHEEEKSALNEEIQHIKTEKAQTCNALRTEFGSALDSRDNILSGLRETLDALKIEKLECEEKYESENHELRSRLQEYDDGNVKLETEVAELTRSLENVSAELVQVRREKDNIGDSIRAEFDHICSGLRFDLERALKERDEIARAMEVRLYKVFIRSLLSRYAWFGGLLTRTHYLCYSPSFYKSRCQSMVPIV